MKPIRIQNRLVLFSRRPGHEVLIPGTNQIVRIFPKRIEMGEAVASLSAAVRDFTLFLDLERGEVRVQGMTEMGPLRARLAPNLESNIPFDGQLPHLERQHPKIARLSLGCHKKLEWERVWERCDPVEFLPIWFALGQWTPGHGGELRGCWQENFRAHFRGLLVPEASDVWHWGVPGQADPLHSGINRIENMLVRDDLTIEAPQHFACGRLLNFAVGDLELDLEWSKHGLRRMRLLAQKSQSVTLPHRCRLRGEMVDAGAPFALSEGEEVWLDRFE